MKTESQDPNQHELERHLAEWCKENNIKIFLFDLDDTVCQTRKVFQEKMSQSYDYLATQVPVFPREKWREEVETTNNKAFEKYGVNPDRWNHVVDDLAGKYFLDENISQEVKRIFKSIYITPPLMMDGAEEGLSFIKRAGIKIGIVTHAGSEWTWRKYNWLDLKRFVDWNDVFIVDENGHKTSESWTEAIRYFGIEAGECAVVGDSPRSDINPARAVGVKHCFLVENPAQWSVHNQPVDSGVKKINNLIQISEVILRTI